MPFLAHHSDGSIPANDLQLAGIIGTDRAVSRSKVQVYAIAASSTAQDARMTRPDLAGRMETAQHRLEVACDLPWQIPDGASLDVDTDRVPVILVFGLRN